MGIRGEFRLGLFLLTAALLATAVGAIALLDRIAPAVDRIVRENVVSLEAVEEMLTAVASLSVPGSADTAKRRFLVALAAAEENVTGEEEPAVLSELRRRADATFAGDSLALRQALAALGQLSAVNRQAVRDVEREARRLGSAGAWAVAALALAGFVASRFVARRFARRLFDPIEELGKVLEAAEEGNRFRRCRTAGAAKDVAETLQRVNRLLDARVVSLDPRRT